MNEARKKAIIRRRIFIAVVSAALVLAIALVSLVIVLIGNAIGGNEENNSSRVSVVSSENEQSEIVSSEEEKPQYVTIGEHTLDASFSNTMLINAENPLPEDYDANVRADLVTIASEYRNNNYVTDIHKDVYPYVEAMVSAAQKDGVDLRVWSPFRSYAIQNDLFRKQVERAGGDEDLAATVVARPGTSEHNTGLCADFNMASDTFETTPMFTWMQENAEDYGFILRYPKDKTDITGVIYESWHWRFVGIYTAREMNELGLTLEEYVELKNN